MVIDGPSISPSFCSREAARHRLVGCDANLAHVVFTDNRPSARASQAIDGRHDGYAKKRRQKPSQKHLVTIVYGGDAGIRTLDTGFGPYAPLAGECLRPLGHVSGKREIIRVGLVRRQIRHFLPVISCQVLADTRMAS